MSQSDQDKTEQPTPFRLDEARKRGEVAKSMDASTALVMIAFAAIIGLSAPGIADAMATTTVRMIVLAGQAPGLNGEFLGWTLKATAPLWQALTPLLLGLPIAAVLGNTLQTGPMFTAFPLKPDFKRMNPMQTLQRIFSMKSLWELAKNIIKIGLLAGLCVTFVWRSQGLIEGAASTEPQRIGDLLLSLFVRVSVYVLLIIALMAMVDLLFTKRDFMRRMRMSRRELKDEIKRRDGDPAVKSRQRQQIRELLRKTRALAKVKDADFVLTNPTHVAVALRYRPGQTLAPVVLAKGAGSLSARIRKLAAKHAVPIVRSPALARALYSECEIDGMVPVERYGALAPVYREVWAMREQNR
jgi:flagellar biosynthesis protein FlhB